MNSLKEITSPASTKNRFKPKEIWRCQSTYSAGIIKRHLFIVLGRRYDRIEVFNIPKNCFCYISLVAFEEWSDCLFFDHFERVK